MAIVADVRTGDILAMATVDGANNEHPAGPAPASEQNKPATVVYEPGSTNKVITMAGAIEDKLVTPDTTFDDIGSEVVVGGTTYTDVDSHPSTMSVADILEHSSNVGTIRIAGMLGFKPLRSSRRTGRSRGARISARPTTRCSRRALQRHEHGLDAHRKRHRGQRSRCSTST
jgi:cell division protein FtsI/penicillin-binding protein 2